MELNMETGFASCSAFTRMEEGGYVADRRDSGNWTTGHVGQGKLIGSNMGVGAPALVAWLGSDVHATAEQMRTLPLSMYESIARRNYWSPLGCGMLPAGIDLMSFDFGWNRGPPTSLDILCKCLGIDHHQTSRMSPAIVIGALQRISPGALLQQISESGIQTLQQILGVRVDGVAGTETHGALRARQDLRVTAIILALSAAQVTSYRQLGGFPMYGRGWLARSARRQEAALLAAHQATSRLAEPLTGT